MTPTDDNWTGTSGSWSTAADWSTGVPGLHSAVNLSPTTGVNTITYDTDDEIYSLTGKLHTTLDLTGGLLKVDNNSSGLEVIDMADDATLTVGVGANLAFSGGVIAGALSGLGTMSLLGLTTLNAGASVTVSHLAVNAPGQLLINTSVTYAGVFTENTGGLNLAKNTLTLSGKSDVLTNSVLSGDGGILNITGTTSIVSGMNVGQATIQDAKSMTLGGHLALNGELLVKAGATLTFTNAVQVSTNNEPNLDNVLNNGTLTVGDPNGSVSQINGVFRTSSALAIDADDTLDLLGTATIGGAVSGAGKLLLSSGSVAIDTANVTVSAITLNGGAAADVTTLDDTLTYAGVFHHGRQARYARSQ